MATEPWMLDAGVLAREYGTDVRAGLSADEVTVRRGTFGPNELTGREHAPAWRLFASQFTNTMILVLAAAAVITAFIGDRKGHGRHRRHHSRQRCGRIRAGVQGRAGGGALRRLAAEEATVV